MKIRLSLIKIVLFVLLGFWSLQLTAQREYHYVFGYDEFGKLIDIKDFVITSRVNYKYSNGVLTATKMWKRNAMTIKGVHYKAQQVKRIRHQKSTDTVRIVLVPTEQYLAFQYIDAFDTIVPKTRDTIYLENTYALQKYAINKIHLIKEPGTYCGESICAWGRTFRYKLVVDSLGNNTYRISAIQNVFHSNRKRCEYLEDHFQRMVIKMPIIVLKNNIIKDNSPWICVFTITL